MLIKYLGVLIMSYQLMGTVVCQDYNPKILDRNADTHSRLIWSRIPISEEQSGKV